MAPYIADCLMRNPAPFSYKQIFTYTIYRKYKPAVDAILVAEGRSELIVPLDWEKGIQ